MLGAPQLKPTSNPNKPTPVGTSESEGNRYSQLAPKTENMTRANKTLLPWAIVVGAYWGAAGNQGPVASDAARASNSGGKAPCAQFTQLSSVCR